MSETLDRVVGVCPKHGVVYEYRALPAPLHLECPKSLEGQYEQTCGLTLTYTAEVDASQEPAAVSGEPGDAT